MGLNIGQIVEVEGKGRMLVQSVGKKVVLIGRGPSNNQIKTIRSIEINPANISQDDKPVRLKEPYESLLVSNRQNQEYHVRMDEYLDSRGL